MVEPMRNWIPILLLLSGIAWAQPSDTDESAYTPSTLARIMVGAAISKNDEA